MTNENPVDGTTDGPAEEQNQTEKLAGDQTVPERADQEHAPSATEGGGIPEPSVNLDAAEMQVSDWRRDDEALLGEAPETTPAPAAGQEAPPQSPEEADVASFRKEGEALLGETPEATPVPTTQEKLS